MSYNDLEERLRLMKIQQQNKQSDYHTPYSTSNIKKLDSQSSMNSNNNSENDIVEREKRLQKMQARLNMLNRTNTPKYNQNNALYKQATKLLLIGKKHEENNNLNQALECYIEAGECYIKLGKEETDKSTEVMLQNKAYEILQNAENIKKLLICDTFRSNMDLKQNKQITRSSTSNMQDNEPMDKYEHLSRRKTEIINHHTDPNLISKKHHHVQLRDDIIETLNRNVAEMDNRITRGYNTKKPAVTSYTQSKVRNRNPEIAVNTVHMKPSDNVFKHEYSNQEESDIEDNDEESEDEDDNDKCNNQLNLHIPAKDTKEITKYDTDRIRTLIRDAQANETDIYPSSELSNLIQDELYKKKQHESHKIRKREPDNQIEESGDGVWI